MRLGSQAVRFSLGPYPVVGNVRSGTIVGLTPEGEALAEELSRRDVAESEVAASCVPLVDYLRANGFMEDGPAAGETKTPPRVRSAYLHVTHL